MGLTCFIGSGLILETYLDQEHPSPASVAENTAHVQNGVGEEGSYDVGDAH